MFSLILSEAEQLLNAATELANHVFGSRLIASYKFGSLGEHGGFSSCSDVDIALIVDTLDSGDKDITANIIQTLQQQKLPFADRLSIFWTSVEGFANGDGRFPAFDRLDFIDHAVLLTGTDIRAGLNKPIADEVLTESADFVFSFMLIPEKQEQLLNSPQAIIAAGARYFSKFILFPVRLLQTIEQPLIIVNNEQAVAAFIAGGISPRLEVLVKQALAAREHDAMDVLAFDLAAYHAELKQLYRQCLESYLPYSSSSAAAKELLQKL